MRKLLLLAFFFNFSILMAVGQGAIIFFEPKPIDSILQAKLFYRQGFFIEADNIRFKNDTNYFTIYVVNNSLQPIELSAIFRLETSDGEPKLDGLVIELLENGQPSEIVAELWERYYTSHNPRGEDVLQAGYYIRQEIKIACPNCKNKDRRTARLKLFIYKKYKNDTEKHYLSNSFELFYDKDIFYKLNIPRQLIEYYSLTPTGLALGRWYSMNDSADSNISVFIEDALDEKVAERKLSQLGGKLSVYKNNVLTDSFMVSKFIIYLVDGKNSEIKYISSETGDIIPTEYLKKIEHLQKGDIIGFCNIEIIDNKEVRYDVNGFFYTIE